MHKPYLLVSLLAAAIASTGTPIFSATAQSPGASASPSPVPRELPAKFCLVENDAQTNNPPAARAVIAMPPFATVTDCVGFIALLGAPGIRVGCMEEPTHGIKYWPPRGGMRAIRNGSTGPGGDWEVDGQPFSRKSLGEFSRCEWKLSN